MSETNKTLLIGDSQLRNVQIDEIDVQYKSGLCTDSMLTEINKATLAQCDQIILWVGGNDAYPRHRNYDLTKTMRQFQNAMNHSQGETKASIVIVSATRRSKDPHRRIRTINVALAELASKNKASFFCFFDYILFILVRPWITPVFMAVPASKTVYNDQSIDTKWVQRTQLSQDCEK